MADISTTLTSRTTGASSPCLRQGIGADFLELLEDFDVTGFVSSEPAVLRGPCWPSRGCSGPVVASPRRLRPAALRSGSTSRSLGDGDFRRDDRLDVVAGHELDVVHREDVGRIRHRDGQRGAGAAERDDLILIGGVGGNELDDPRVDVELRRG